MAGLVLTTFLLLSTGATAADTSESLGTGTHPSAVWTRGRANTGYLHVVWATSTKGQAPNTGNAIVYCRYQSGRCLQRSLLLAQDRSGAFSAPEITAFGPDNRETLVITDTRCCDATRRGRYVLVSQDDGRTWRVAHPSLVDRGAAQAWVGRRGLLEVVNSADGSLSFVGGSTFSFSLPTIFQRVSLDGVQPVEPTPGDFQRGLGKPVRAQALGLLPDGRLFAVGHNDDGKTFWRVNIAGSDPNDIKQGWTRWAPLAIKGFITSIAYRPGRRTWLMYVGSSYEPRIVSFDGARLGKPRLLGGSMIGDQTVAPAYGHQDLFMDEAGALHATWVTAGEGCLRTKLCLVYRYAEDGQKFEPTEILRVVSPERTTIELPQIARFYRIVSVERRRNAPVGTIMLSEARFPHRSSFGTKGSPRRVRLVIPETPVVGRSFTGRIAELDDANDRRVTSVKFTLLPPSCPPRTVDCSALRRPVVIERTEAPFAATFRVPEAATITTSHPLKNRLCTATAYVYVLKADVFVRSINREQTLKANVSVCPKVG